MRALMGVALAAAVMAALPAFGQQQSSPAESPGKWGGFLDLEGKLGTDRHLGEADLFVPLAQDGRNLLFANVKARLDDNDSKEGNFGAGWRHMHASGWNGGLYGYFDRRRTTNDHLFNQLTFGAEALGEDFDFRANSYWPIGKKIKLAEGENTAELSGTSVIFRGGEEHALQGFDAEVGWRVPVFEAGGPIDLRLYAGGYTFDDDTVDAVTGPRLRAEFITYEVPELMEGSRITLGAEWQHDEPRGGQGFFSARLRIPLQPEKERSRKLTAQEWRMTAPVVRDVDIVAQAGAFGAPETVSQTAGGSAINVVSSAASNGAALQTALTNAGANSTVILTGTFDTAGNVMTLQAGQTLMGNGAVQVRSPSGRVATLTTATGASVTGNVGGNNYTFVMANNSTLEGLTINNTDGTGNNAQAVRVNGVSNVRVLNNVINSTQTNVGGTSHGIDVHVGSSNVTLSGNRVTVTGGGSALALQVQNSTGVTITNNTATATTTNAHTFGLILDTSTVTVSGNTLSASGAAITNAAVDIRAGATTINSGSTNNVRSAGTCNNTGTVTGSISFTNGTTCP